MGKKDEKAGKFGGDIITEFKRSTPHAADDKDIGTCSTEFIG